jgi:hypothetical protein
LTVGWRKSVFNHDELDAVCEHLWQWMSVDYRTFGVWSEFESPVLDAALGDELPAELSQQCEERGVDAAEFKAVLASVVEITYFSLYGAACDAESLEFLRHVLEVGAAADITPPSAEPFAQSLFTDGDGVGRPTVEEVQQWRRL